MKIFLTLKHWQIFGLLLGLPIIMELFEFGSIVSNRNTPTTFYLFSIIMLIAMVIFFGWFYALGTNIQNKIPESLKMNLKRFKIFLFIPVVYMFFVLVFMVSTYTNISESGPPNPIIFAIIVPLHLFSMFCIFYCLFFIAKSLKTLELQRTITFSDFAGEFFLIWFFPFGIWFIQPRINKLFDDISDEIKN